MLFSTLATVLTLAGVTLILFSWRRAIPHGVPVLIAGWLVVSFSIYFWVRSQGIEYGLVVGLTVPSVFAWLMVLTQLKLKKAVKQRSDRRSPVWPRGQIVARQLATFVLVFFATGIASLMLSTGVSRLVPTSEITRMAVTMLLFPVIWACIAFMLTYSRQFWVGVATVGLSGGIGYALIVV